MQLLIPLELLQDNPWQPRQHIDAAHIDALAASIARDGLLQIPLGRVVKADGTLVAPKPLADLTADIIAAHGWRVQLAFGHSRLAAYRQLAETLKKYDAMPIELRVLADESMANFGWAENNARKDLNAIEEAEAIAKRLDDFKWTHAQAATHMGLERSVISNKLRLLKLRPETQEQIRTGELSQRQALALVPLLDLPAAAIEAVKGTWRDPAGIYLNAPNDSAETIRVRVKGAIEHLTQALESATFGLDEELTGPDIVAPACRTCDQRLKSANRCPLKACFDAKAGQVRARQLAAAAAAAGLPVEGRKLEYNERTTIWLEHEKKVIAAGCPKGNLRVIGGTGERPEIACVHGARKRCTCLAAVEKADTKTRETKAADSRAAALEVLQPVVTSIVAQLQGIASRGLLLAIAARIGYDIQTSAEKHQWSIAQIQEAIAQGLIGIKEYRALYSAKDAEEALPKLLEAFELTIPTPRAELLAQLEQLHESLRLVAAVPPVPEQLPGVLTNLRDRWIALEAALGPGADAPLRVHLDMLGSWLAQLDRAARGEEPLIRWAPAADVSANTPAAAELEAA